MSKYTKLSHATLSLAMALPVGAAVLALPATLSAQAISGDLLGVVTDSSGAVVPGAQVTVTNIATGVIASSTTGKSGEYRFSNLPVGHYSVQVNGNGLTGGYQDVNVQLNKQATANITASIGQQSTTVEVAAEATPIDTTTQQIQNTFEQKQTSDLPTTSIGFGVLNLSLLNAGATNAGGVGVGTGPSISGQRPRNNNYTIEGVDDNNKAITGPLLSIPNDAVQNFTVLQNQFSPEYGHSSGGQFNTVIISGTNKLHGRAYEYFQNRNLNAIDSQEAITERANGQPIQNPRFDNNRFGGQLGGPIWKDKVFFFTNHEYNPIGQVASNNACAPTAAGYAALAGAPGISANNLTVLQQNLPAAASQAAASSGQCGGDFDGGANGLAYGNVLVGGTAVPIGPVGFAGNLFNNTYTTANSLDVNMSQTDQLRFRYVYSKNDQLDTLAQLPSFWLPTPQRFHVVTASEYHTFSPTVNNEFRFGFNRFSQLFNVPSATFPGLNVFPNLTVEDLDGANIGPDPNAPQFTIQNLYQAVDNITWVKGKHNLKFGVEGRKYISPQSFTQRGRGDYFWTTLSGYLADAAPDEFGERSTGNFNYYGDQSAIYAYGNDEFRVTPNLTLDLGLRYEFTSVPAGERVQALNAAASVPGLINFAEPKPQYKNFAPRVGFAYSPGTSGNTSIRGGFGMAYDVLFDNLGTLSFPPQFSGTCDVVGSVQTSTCFFSNAGFLANGALPAGPGTLQSFATVADQRASTAAFVPNQKLPYSENWNFGIQHLFAKKYTAEIRYVGTRGIHQTAQVQINKRAVVTPTHFLPTFLAAPTQAQLDALPLTLDALESESNLVPAFEAAGFASNITSFQPFGQSIYHGLQTQLNRSFTNGLQFQVAWTWSHAQDNSTADVFSTVLTPRRPQDFQNLANDMSTSALDRRHRVTVQMIYDLPFFKKSNGFLRNVLGNWEVAPIYTFQSPEYATVQAGGVDANLNGDAAGDRAIINPAGVAGTGSGVTAVCTSGFATSAAAAAGATCGGSVDLPNGTTLGTDQFVVGYLANNPNARYIATGAGALSTAGRNTLPLPRTNNWDLTALKRVNLTERMAIEFQAQALNLFNHPQYLPGYLNRVDTTGLDFTVGQLTALVRPNNSAFNNPKLALSNQPRQMLLVAKFIF